MRAPRPTLLIYKCRRQLLFSCPQKPYIYDDIRPFFRLLSVEGVFAWHENVDPGTHNYQVDNRQTAYRFITKYFDLAGPEDEIPVDSEIKSMNELKVGLPTDNLTILGLQGISASNIQRPSFPSSGVEKAYGSRPRGPTSRPWYVTRRLP